MRSYTELCYIADDKISYDKFKSAVEAISDGNYTLKFVRTVDANVDRYISGGYVVDIVDNNYYQEYWS